MRNLYVRIFVSFWTAMVLVLTFTVMATLWLGDQRAQREQTRQDQLAREASRVLADSGVPGLRDWLTHESARAAPDRLFVLDRHGSDLLGRHVPDFLRARFGHSTVPGKVPDLPPDARDVRWLSQLISPSDETYALSLLRLRRGPLGIFSSTETPIITAIATLMVSTIVCFLLARYLSDPIRHLRSPAAPPAPRPLPLPPTPPVPLAAPGRFPPPPAPPPPPAGPFVGAPPSFFSLGAR